MCITIHPIKIVSKDFFLLITSHSSILENDFCVLLGHRKGGIGEGYTAVCNLQPHHKMQL